jgi:type I restriction enzyme R subunit
MIGGQAKAMVITGGIRLAIEYYHGHLQLPDRTQEPMEGVVAFSGEHEYGGQKVTEASLNGFPSNIIPDRFGKILIDFWWWRTNSRPAMMNLCCIPCMWTSRSQTSKLCKPSPASPAHPQKHDTFVLDFFNDSDAIQAAFAPYYRTTILSEETDPNRLHDLKADLDGYQFYNWIEVNHFVEL